MHAHDHDQAAQRRTATGGDKRSEATGTKSGNHNESAMDKVKEALHMK